MHKKSPGNARKRLIKIENWNNDNNADLVNKFVSWTFRNALLNSIKIQFQFWTKKINLENEDKGIVKGGDIVLKGQCHSG